MATATQTGSLQLTGAQDCIDWMLSGAKPRDQFAVGTEHERICVGPDGRPLPYDGDVSIRALLEGIADRFGWERKTEAGRTVALKRGLASITLEPAGQFELSGAPLANVAAMVAEHEEHLREVAAVASPLGIRFAYVGLNPIDTPQTAPKMPKERYGHMRAWMPRVGSLGLDMMHLTCTVQVNIDFRDDNDAMTALRLGLLATPAVIALFANSPWHRGGPTGMASQRAHIWTDVDAKRCEAPPWMFAPGATVADYVDWALSVPMYFVEKPRIGREHELLRLPEGFSFGDFLGGGFGGVQPTLAAWETHVGTLFPDVRLKRYVEIRGADCVPPRLLPALPALVTGLFYDDDARAEALTLLSDGDDTIDRSARRAAACQLGLNAVADGWTMRQEASELLRIARRGLERLQVSGREAAGTTHWLDELTRIASGEQAPLYADANAALQTHPSLLSVAETSLL